LKEKHTKFSRGLSFLCGMSLQFICKGTKEFHPNQWSIVFEMGRVYFLCLLCGLEGLQLLALWVNWGCFSTWFLLLFYRDFFLIFWCSVVAWSSSRNESMRGVDPRFMQVC
jgi:hypothetical protein